MSFALILQYVNYNCLLSGSPSVNSTQYYYGDYRYHCRHPWPKRELRSCVEQMRSIDAEDRPSKRSDMAKLSGFTGLSILHRLFSLYGFNVLSHLVLDAMHIIPLNVISHHLHHYFDDKIVRMDDVELRLKHMSWTQGECAVIGMQHANYTIILSTL